VTNCGDEHEPRWRLPLHDRGNLLLAARPVPLEDRRRRSEHHQAAHGTDRERAAADGLVAADERVSTREAWVKWVERGY
jgi:hypothetical protein